MFVLVLCLAALIASALEREPLDAYKARRDALAAKLNDGVIVISGATEPVGPDATQGFKQNENFYYLTGWPEPDAALMIDGKRQVLFIPSRNVTQEKWTGPKLSPSDPNARSQTGFDVVMSTDALESEVKRAVRNGGKVYKGDSPQVQAQIAALRQVKAPSEIALMEKAIRATMDAHREAMRAIRPGMMEYELAALMKYTFERAGCERPAYAAIVGSGFNSTVLHYSRNDRRMEAGDVVVIDVGGEYSGYAADITRTLPVSGKFTQRQREIYEVVLGAQKAAIAAIRPGMNIARSGRNSIHVIAADYINSKGLGKYFIHGTSHHLGLNVHDVGEVSRPLEAGMVITVEPGVYIPEEKIGVRIEDIVLVTQTGARVLTDGLPREVDEVERAMRH